MKLKKLKAQQSNLKNAKPVIVSGVLVELLNKPIIE